MSRNQRLPTSACLPSATNMSHVVALQCLFLHADTMLPAGFGQLITDAVSARDKRLLLPSPPPQQQQLVGFPGPLQALHDSWQRLWGQPQQNNSCASAKQPAQQEFQSERAQQSAVWGCFSSIQLDQVGRVLCCGLVCSVQAGSHATAPMWPA